LRCCSASFGDSPSGNCMPNPPVSSMRRWQTWQRRSPIGRGTPVVHDALQES
jgi:hypothetical protein